MTEIITDERPLSAEIVSIWEDALLSGQYDRLSPMSALRLIRNFKAHDAELAIQADTISRLCDGVKARDEKIARLKYETKGHCESYVLLQKRTWDLEDKWRKIVESHGVEIETLRATVARLESEKQLLVELNEESLAAREETVRKASGLVEVCEKKEAELVTVYAQLRSGAEQMSSAADTINDLNGKAKAFEERLAAGREWNQELVEIAKSFADMLGAALEKMKEADAPVVSSILLAEEGLDYVNSIIAKNQGEVTA